MRAHSDLWTMLMAFAVFVAGIGLLKLDWLWLGSLLVLSGGATVSLMMYMDGIMASRARRNRRCVRRERR